MKKTERSRHVRENVLSAGETSLSVERRQIMFIAAWVSDYCTYFTPPAHADSCATTRSRLASLYPCPERSQPPKETEQDLWPKGPVCYHCHLRHQHRNRHVRLDN